MAATDFGAQSAARVRIWSSDLWKETRDNSFFFANGFVGKGDSDMTRPIHRVTELTETKRGLEVVMQLVADLDEDGTVGDNLLEGNEEPLLNDTQVIRVDQLRHGVRSRGAIAEQATVIRFRAQARDHLSFWMPDKIDELMFLTGSGRSYALKLDGTTRASTQLTQLDFASDVAAPSAGRIRYAGTATSEGSIALADKIGWNEIVALRTFMTRKRIRPIMDRGKPYYAIVISPEQERDLLQDSTYQTIVSRGDERGRSKNLLFQTAMAAVSGCILHSHRKVYNTLGAASGAKWGAGSTVDGAQALAMGSQALGFATIGNVAMKESDNTDYGNRPAIGVGRKLGMLKPRFKTRATTIAEDFGIVSYKTAAAEA